MILRVRITKTGCQILCNWALHRVSDTVLLKNVASELVTGSGGNQFFDAIEPFYLQCQQIVAKAGM